MPGDTTRTTSRRTSPLAFFRVLDLFTDRDPKPFLDESRNVRVGRVVGHAAHRDRTATAVLRPRRQGQLEGARGDEGILVEHLVEVAHAEEDEGVGVL